MARENLSIHQRPGHLGLSLAFAHRRTPLVFPLQANAISPRQLIGDPGWARLAAFEQLWVDGHLVELGEDKPGTYRLPWAHYFLLSPDDRQLACLPEPTIPEISLTVRGTVVQPNFRIIADVRADGIAGNLLNWGKRTGPWIPVGAGALVLDQRAVQLLDLLSFPVDSDFDARVALMAEVKELAEGLHARMDRYLSSEDYRLVADLDIEVRMDEPDRIDFDVVYRSDDVTPLVLQKLQDRGYVEKREGIRRERTIVPKRTREQRAEVQRALPAVQGQDVPVFLLNPDAFLPEDLPIDLSRFSERVKGLKRRLYRAQPFISADPKDRGWFALEGQVRVLGSETDDSPPVDVLTPAEVKSLIEAQPEADFVPFHGGWLDVRSARADTMESLETANEMGPVSLDRLPFVLDIFTNLEAIEFDRPLRDVIWTKDAIEGGVPALPLSFEGSLHEYQHDGFAFMVKRHERQWGVLLADEMGLGKTVQVIAFLTWLKEQGKRPILIVAPVALLETWSQEIRRFAPQVQAAAHYGAGRAKFSKVPEHVDVVLSTYDTVARDQLMLAQVDWECVILDEAQQIKNSSTARAEAIKALKNKSRLALTGTPVENSLSDLWALVDFVQPGFLGSLKGFRAQYELTSGSDREIADQVQHSLARSLTPIYLRRTKDEVKINLPPKQVQRILVPMGEEQQRAYRQIVGLVQQKRQNALAALRQLQEVLGHPWAHQDSANWGALPPTRIPKLKATLDILSKVKHVGEKALVFTPSLRLQRMLQYWVMEELDVVPLLINGQSQDRQHLVSHFNAVMGFSVLIVTPKSAGFGLTITGANHVIHYTRWWNPAVEKQATDRVHRIGQTRPVTVYYPIVVDEQHRITEKGTVEEILDELLRDKQALADNVVVPSGWLNVDQELLARTFR